MGQIRRIFMLDRFMVAMANDCHLILLKRNRKSKYPLDSVGISFPLQGVRVGGYQHGFGNASLDSQKSGIMFFGVF